MQSPVLQGLAAFFATLLASLLLSPTVNSKHVILYSVLLQALLVFAVPLGLAKWLGLKKRATFHLLPTSIRNLLWCLVLTFCSLFLLDEIALWQQEFSGVSASLSPDLQRLLRAESAGALISIFFSLALMPAVCEEFLFRGFILSRFLSTGNLGQSLMMTAVLFGVFHRNVAALLVTSLAGFLLAFVAWRTGSLYNAIVVHTLVNGWAIVVINTRLVEWMPWLSGTSHVPIPLQMGCMAGVLISARFLRQPKSNALI